MEVSPPKEETIENLGELVAFIKKESAKCQVVKMGQNVGMMALLFVV